MFVGYSFQVGPLDKYGSFDVHFESQISKKKRYVYDIIELHVFEPRVIGVGAQLNEVGVQPSPPWEGFVF